MNLKNILFTTFVPGVVIESKEVRQKRKAINRHCKKLIKEANKIADKNLKEEEV